MSFTYEFIDNGKSLTIVTENSRYTAGKNDLELVISTQKPTVLNIRSNSSKYSNFNVDVNRDTILGVGAGSATAQDLMIALQEVFFLTDGGGGGNGGNVIDGDVYLNNLFEVEKDAQGNIIKTKSIYDFQVPPESIEVGEAIKISDLGQSLSYSTKFDGKQYLLMGYEITNAGSSRPFVKELQAPTEFEVQPLFDEQQTYTTQQSFPIVSFQDVIGKTYNLKAFTSSDNFRVRLVRRATNGGQDTIIVDETISGTQTNISGFDFDLSPITDFTINTDYDLILSVEDGDTFDVLGSTIDGTFLPYVKRQFGWEYTKKDIAYLDDIQNTTVITDETLTGDGTAQNPLSVVGTTEGKIEVIGFWDADTNTPDLSSLTLTQGQAYQVSVAGDTLLNNNDEWNEFDLALWVDTVAGNWFRVVSTEKVLSVNGKKGDVVIDKSDIGLDQVDNTSDQDKPLSDATINALANKVDVGGNITDLNNDAGYISSVAVDGVTVLGDGVNTPLSATGGGSDNDSYLLKTNIVNDVLLTTNTAGQYSALDCIGSIRFSEGSGWNTENDGVTVPEDGTYEVSLGIVFDSAGQRPTPVVSLSIDGSLVGDESSNAYIRNSSGINSASCVLTTLIPLTAGQKVGIQARREGTTTAATRTVNSGSFFNIKKVSNPVSDSGVSSLGELSDVDLTTPPEINQVLKYNGVSFIPQNESGGGGNDGNVIVIDTEVEITQNSWSGNTNYVYNNIAVEGVEVGQLCIIYPSPAIWQTIQANGATWDGYAYCNSNGLVTAVCRISSFISIAPLSTFSIKVVEKISTFASLFSEPIKQELDVYSENINVSHLDHNKHFNILSPLNYSVILPSLDDVEMTHVYKFKNLNDSTLQGLFVPVFGEKIENQNDFELYGRGTLSIRKKYNNDGAFWSIVEISNLFDHVGQGKSKEIAFNDHTGSLEIIHNRGYRPIIKIYTDDGEGGYSEADVDIDHNTNLNSFIVNLEGVNTGFVRYV